MITDRNEKLIELEQQLQTCKSCKLGETRNNLVFARGSEQAKLMFIGEGPGATEDEKGIPFCGRAGQLLDKLFSEVGISQDEIYIANIVKCRPPNNRVPASDEVGACLPYLREQFRQVNPKIIVCLGASAAKAIIDPKFQISKQRGQFIDKLGYKFVAIFHPAALLYTPSKKDITLKDLRMIKEEYIKIDDI